MLASLGGVNSLNCLRGASACFAGVNFAGLRSVSLLAGPDIWGLDEGSNLAEDGLLLI